MWKVFECGSSGLIGRCGAVKDPPGPHGSVAKELLEGNLWVQFQCIYIIIGGPVHDSSTSLLTREYRISRKILRQIIPFLV